MFCGLLSNIVHHFVFLNFTSLVEEMKHMTYVLLTHVGNVSFDIPILALIIQLQKQFYSFLFAACHFPPVLVDKILFLSISVYKYRLINWDLQQSPDTVNCQTHYYFSCWPVLRIDIFYRTLCTFYERDVKKVAAGIRLVVLTMMKDLLCNRFLITNLYISSIAIDKFMF